MWDDVCASTRDPLQHPHHYIPSWTLAVLCMHIRLGRSITMSTDNMHCVEKVQKKIIRVASRIADACSYVYVNACVYVHICMCQHVNTCPYMHVSACRRVSVRTCVSMQTHARTCMCKHSDACAYGMCEYIDACACVHV